MRYLTITLVFCLYSCGDSSEHIIQEHLRALGDVSGIESIITTADCNGPEGGYVTVTQSSFKGDYLLFLQDYEYKPNPFYALIQSSKQGFGLDTNLVSQGPLSKAIIAVLKAHEFHEMMLQPHRRYFDLKQLEDTTFFDQKCTQLIGSDHLGLPVRLYFDKKTHLMAGIAQVNPYKKGEVISVHFEDWNYTQAIPLFNRVFIKQGKNDEYTLNYTQILFNQPEFEELLVRED